MKLLIITYWDYHDALIQTYTLPYVRLMLNQTSVNKVVLVTLQQSDKTIQNPDENIEVLPLRYHRFGAAAVLKMVVNTLILIRKIRKENIKAIHCWCTTAGVYGLILKLCTGRRLIIDSFEPHAEPMLEAGVWQKNSLAFQILFLCEKLQAKYANHLIACVASMKSYSEKKYGIMRHDMLWKPACVDFEHFDFAKRKNEDLLNQLGLADKIVCVYAGKFGGSYYGIEVFQFIKEAYAFFGDSFRFLLLSNHPKEEISTWMQELDIPAMVLIQTFVDHRVIPNYIGLGDFGLVPFIPVPSKRYGSPIKTGEYMAMGLPIVISDGISDDSALVSDHKIGYVLRNQNVEEYHRALESLASLMENRTSTSQKVVGLAKQYKNYHHIGSIYSSVYD
ncbi:MAG: glycosyltransferase [Cyclobacteriaceae bacterium]